MQEARWSWVEVITRKGSSLQPALCTSSASPFPSRGSDSKRTASVSTGSLEETTQSSELLKVHEVISKLTFHFLLSYSETVGVTQ